MTLKTEAVGRPLPESRHPFDWKDAALYALAVGAGADDLDLLLETRPLKVLPTFSVIPTFKPLLSGLAAAGVPLSKVLHGEQDIRLHAPIPRRGTLLTRSEIAGIWDVGKHAIVHMDTHTTLEGADELLFDTRWTIVVRGAGGFGGQRPPKVDMPTPPEDRAPDLEVDLPTAATQALLYRLTGDVNPLHADPRMATAVGFKRPILHGLCTYGFAGLAVLRAFADGDPTRMKGFFARFSREVYPGDTLTVQAWRDGDRDVLVQAKVGDRVVLSNGRVTLS